MRSGERLQAQFPHGKDFVMQSNTQTQAAQSNQKLKALVDEALKIGFAKYPKKGDVIAGAVLSKDKAVLYADFGTLGIGMVFGREYQEASDIIKHMKPGDAISAKVVELENDKGFIELSLKEAGYTLAWDDLEAKRRSGEVLEVEIREANKGGLIAEINNVFAFMPVSQLSTKNYPRVDGGNKAKIQQELGKFVGVKFKVKVIDVNQAENKLIISEKEAQDEDMKKALEQYAVGDVVDGEVSGVVNFGIFVKFKPRVEAEGIAQLEGLAHISELDWQLIENPADLYRVGDPVSAKIIAIDGDKVSLSVKALKKDPWENIDERFKKGDKVRGVVTKVNPFGAFVRIDSDIQGLCHISEFGSDEEMKKQLEAGKEYEFYVQSVVKQEHRMALGFGAAPKKVPAKRSAKPAAEAVAAETPPAAAV